MADYKAQTRTSYTVAQEAAKKAQAAAVAADRVTEQVETTPEVQAAHKGKRKG
jgi:hypothetical protein